MTPFVCGSLCAAVPLIIGLFLGAWLTHRAERRQSPFPVKPQQIRTVGGDEPVEQPKKKEPRL